MSMSHEDFICDTYALTGQDAEIIVRYRYDRMIGDTVENVVDDEASQMLAILLIKEKVFLNAHWWEKEWPEKARRTTSVNALCNDVFMWGYADVETMEYADIPDVYEHFEKDADWGVEVWCIKKRRMMPQRPVYDRIKKQGIWDLDTMGLADNPTWKPKLPSVAP